MKPRYTSLAAAAVALGLTAGCNLELPKVDPNQQQQNQTQQGAGIQDPSLEALRAVNDALAAAREFDFHMPPPPTSPPPPGAPAQLAGDISGPTGQQPPKIYCDAVPDVTFEDVCGMDQIVTAHVAWSGCSLQPPPSGDAQQQPPQQEQVVTSGIIDTAVTIDEAVCSPVTTVTFTRTTDFSITKKTSRGEDTTAGNVGVEGTQALAPGDISRTMALDVTASVAATDGTRKGFALKGDLNIAVKNEPNKPPVTSLDGKLDRSGDAPESLTLTGVEQGDPKTCRFPMKGQITRDLPDGQKHTLVFGPSCGDATLDGKKISLNPQPPQQQQDGQQPPPQ